MRRFSAEYLETTRAGMWADSQEALADLDLATRERVLDVGAGSGELTRVLRDAVPGDVIALDADLDLLGAVEKPTVGGDATNLPFRDDTFDLVVCQALLVNLPEPIDAIEEFRRVASDRIAVIEPDNSGVTIESTVSGESALEQQARQRYLDGIETDVTIGTADELLESADITVESVARYDHERVIEAPYSNQELEDARRKASGAGLDSDRETILAGETTEAAFDRLRDEWRAMGREVIEQMQDDRYRHAETVPFYVTVGTV
jgi:ubiquinone/menaquinone biosynthesis C-methylase UbiE